MNRTNRILSSLKLANSLSSTQFFYRSHSLYNRVSPFLPSLSHYISSFLPKLFFSSTTPQQISDLVLTEDWSTELENKLSMSNLKLTHEFLACVLKNLDECPRKAEIFFNWVTEKNGFLPSYAVYGSILRGYANRDLIGQFWYALRKMKELGYFLDWELFAEVHAIFKNSNMDHDATELAEFYDGFVKENAVFDVVKEIVEVLKRSDWSHEVEVKLEGREVSVQDDFVLRVMKELRQCPFQALGFLKWVVQSSGFERNSVTFNELLRLLGHGDSIEEFWSTIKEMTSIGYEIDFDTYRKISRRFQKHKMLKDAVELYELMMDGPHKLSVKDLKELLHAISRDENPDLDLVSKVVNKYEAAGNPNSKTVYDGIHRCLTRAGRFDEADKVMEAMRNEGYEPDNVTYSQCIHGLCKARRLEEACEVLDEMEENGCLPDLNTWKTLIKGHCTGNEVDRVLFLLAKMMDKDYDPDGDLLDDIINCSTRHNRIEDAYKLLIEMANKARFRPWKATYSGVIQKLLEERKLEEALDLVLLMRKQNLPPSLEPFHQYISKFGTVDDALKYLKAMSSDGYPCISAHTNIFKSFFQEGRHDEAKVLLHKCPLYIRRHKDICGIFGFAFRHSTSA